MAKSTEPSLPNLLECTICLDVPASRIHNCANGHIICGVCVEKVAKCGLCQSTKLQVSILGERLSRQLDFKLKYPYYDVGCQQVIAEADHTTHKESCEYRDISCTQWTTKKCDGAKFSMKDYLPHLRDHHDRPLRSSGVCQFECKGGKVKGKYLMERAVVSS